MQDNPLYSPSRGIQTRGRLEAMVSGGTGFRRENFPELRNSTPIERESMEIDPKLISPGELQTLRERAVKQPGMANLPEAALNDRFNKKPSTTHVLSSLCLRSSQNLY
jgi:hypothetical protein